VASPHRKTTILVVEDDADVRSLYHMALSMAGYHVVAVGDGIAALRYLDTDRPDGIVLDLGLPRLAGRDVQQEIAAHAETRDIPIIVATGLPAHEHVNVAEVQCVLQKPVKPDELVDAAKRCFPPPSGVAVFYT
jgi:DNA-binding response OmpR family regulator